MRFASLLCIALLAACGGGTDAVVGPGDTAPVVDEPAIQTQRVVVTFDVNGDERPDTLTIEQDGTIVEAVESTDGGGPVDMTDVRKGEKIDGKIADAVAAHVARSIDLASETRLEIVDSNGRTVTVTVYE
ncbi:MAG: hypothetical protein ACYTGN_00125 [Planctomycetota bacterium]|jgi:hypothetical protein